MKLKTVHTTVLKGNQYFTARSAFGFLIHNISKTLYE